MKTDKITAAAYAYVHFAVEVICFYTLYRVFSASENRWAAALAFDTLAFASQPVIGSFAEKHPAFRPGVSGGFLLLAGAAAACFGAKLLWIRIAGLLLLTIGNGLVHIAGALSTLRASEGRLSESAVFVGGGSFGLILGRLMGAGEAPLVIPVLLMTGAVFVSVAADRRLRARYGRDMRDFENVPCQHQLAAKKPAWLIVTILGAVILVRAYIGYCLPTAWNQTTVQTVLLFVTMGCGKMLGGILADRFGARRIGILSCLLAVPALLLGDRIMWLSLIGVLLFSMTMAITLGGLVSVLPRNPGIAFGITTLALLLGTVPVFFVPIPTHPVSDLLIALMSILAALGLRLSLVKMKE